MTAESATLGAHVLAGFLALFAGATALGTEKGGRRHRLAGRVYVASMAVVSLSALALFAFAPSPSRQFLALVAVFSFYFVFSGYRVLSRKGPTERPEAIDWVGAGVMVLAGVGLLVFGATRLLVGASFGVVMAVFGGLGVGFGIRDLRQFRGEPRAWLPEHLTRMSAGYIATVTAFSSVNFLFLPPLARWLWPTLLGTPLIAYFARRYR